MESDRFFPFYTSTPTFESLEVKPTLIDAIKKFGKTGEPCDIQQRVIRAVATGKDVIVDDSRGNNS